MRIALSDRSENCVLFEMDRDRYRRWGWEPGLVGDVWKSFAKTGAENWSSKRRMEMVVSRIDEKDIEKRFCLGWMKPILTGVELVLDFFDRPGPARRLSGGRMGR